MAQQQHEEKEKKPFERLPVDVVPVNYKLELTPDLTAFTFQGQLEITVQVYMMCSYNPRPLKSSFEGPYFNCGNHSYPQYLNWGALTFRCVTE